MVDAEKPRGKYFDDKKHYFEVLRVVRQARKEGANMVGLFGSRAKGTYVPGDSDTDILVVKSGASNWGEYDWEGRDKRIQKVTIPPELAVADPNSRALQRMRDSARVIWKKKV